MSYGTLASNIRPTVPDCMLQGEDTDYCVKGARQFDLGAQGVGHTTKQSIVNSDAVEDVNVTLALNGHSLYE